MIHSVNKNNKFFCAIVLLISMFLISGKAYAQCANPQGEAGEQLFNTTHNVMQYCNGTNWIAMGAPGDDEKLWIANETHIYNSNTGNVGIGIASPEYKLDVTGTTRVTGSIFSHNTHGNITLASHNTANYGSYINLMRNSDGTYWHISGPRGDTDGSLAIFHYPVAPSSPLRLLTLTSAGNVGIGTTSPNATLHINATSGIASTGLSGISINSTSAWGALMINSADSTKTLGIHFGAAANDLRFGRYANNFGAWEANPYVFNLDAPADTLMVNLHGNVGIGKGGSSTHKLDVAGSVRASTNYDLTSGNGKGLRFWESDSYKISMGNTAEYQYGPVTEYSIKTAMSNTTTRGWTWGVAGSTPVAAINTQGHMQLAGNSYIMGNVGIGTTSPSGKLDVNYTGTIDGGDFTKSAINIYNSADSNQGILSIDANTTIHHGSGATVPLGFYGENGTSLGYYNTVTPAPVRVLNVTNTGNIGIGTTSPDAKLEVNTGTYGLKIGGPSTTWAGNTNLYPTIYGTNADQWVMFINPHIPYTQTGVNGFTGAMNGATLRMASNPAATNFWDVGVGVAGIGTDKFAIARGVNGHTANNAFLTITNNGNVGINNTNPTNRLTIGSPSPVNVGDSYYDLGLNTMAAGSSIYSYAYICAGNSDGDCTGTGGVILHAGGNAWKPGGGSWANNSDARLKKDIKPIYNAIDEIRKLNPVKYKWINPEEHENSTREWNGFLAQEVEKYFPDWVNKSKPATGKDKELVNDEYAYSISFPVDFDAYTVKAIQELADKSDAKDKENAELRSEIEQLRVEIREIKSAIGK